MQSPPAVKRAFPFCCAISDPSAAAPPPPEPTLGPERDAMQVYLKNVVVNLLCEPDDAVKVLPPPPICPLPSPPIFRRR